MWVTFALPDPNPDPDPLTWFNPDPIRIRIRNTDSVAEDCWARICSELLWTTVSVNCLRNYTCTYLVWTAVYRWRNCTCISCQLPAKLFLDLLCTAGSCCKSCTWICCEQSRTCNCCEQLRATGKVDLIVDSSELMEKVYLYLLWTAVNWWRSCTCICCWQLLTDGEALPVSAEDSC